MKKSPTSAVRDVGMIGAEPGRVGSPAVDDGRPLQADGEAVVDKALNIGLGKVVAIAGTDFRVVGRTDGVTYFAGIPAVFITAKDAQKLVARRCSRSRPPSCCAETSRSRRPARTS